MEYNLLITEEKRFLLETIFRGFKSSKECEDWLLSQNAESALMNKLSTYIDVKDLKNLLQIKKQVLIVETNNFFKVAVSIGAIAHDYPLVIQKTQKVDFVLSKEDF